MANEHLTITREGPAGLVTLANEARRNALSLEALQELGAAVDEVSADHEVRVVVIAGLGPAFSAGHDLSEMVCRSDDFYAQLFEVCLDVMEALHRLPQPVIAKVDGIATAAGCQLAAACDLVVASDRSRFATPGVRIGLFCHTPMVPVTRSIGRKRALEMLLTGEPIDATTAADWGLVNRVVPPERLDAEVAALVDQIARFSPEIIAMGKRSFYEQIDLPEAEAYARMHQVMAANAAHPEAQEGMSAFLDKREPVWGQKV